MLVSVFLFLGFSENDEKEFKSYANNLKNILIELKYIKGELKTCGTLSRTDQEAFILNLNKKNEFIASKESEFKQLTNQFKSFIDRQPESIWADDSSFCLAMLYLTISNPGNDYYSEAIRQARFFIKKFSTIHIENWTKKHFSEIPSFEIVLNSSLIQSNNTLSNFSEGEAIKVNLLKAIIYEYLKAGKLIDAKAELKILEQEIKNEKIISSLKDDISTFERVQSMIKKSDNSSK